MIVADIGCMMVHCMMEQSMGLGCNIEVAVLGCSIGVVVPGMAVGCKGWYCGVRHCHRLGILGILLGQLRLENVQLPVH